MAWGGLAHAGNADVSSAGHDTKAGAQQMFEAGSNLYDAHKYEEALTAFRASYQVVSSPNSHLMIARCLRDLGRAVEAYREYTSVAAEARAKGGRYESTARAAEEERGELKGKVALVTIKLAEPKEGATFKVNGAPADPATFGTEMAVEPGTITVTGEAPDGSTAKAEAQAAGGSQTTLEITFESQAAATAPPPPPPPVHAETSTGGPPWRMMSYVAAGVGVVGLGAFAVLGSMSNSKYNSLQDKCGAGGASCPPGSQSDIDSGKSLQTFANVGLVVGVVGVAAGATFFVLSLNKHKTEETANATSLYFGPGSVSVKGSL